MFAVRGKRSAGSGVLTSESPESITTLLCLQVSGSAGGLRVRGSALLPVDDPVPVQEGVA